jgi:hypothetical protein
MIKIKKTFPFIYHVFYFTFFLIIINYYYDYYYKLLIFFLTRNGLLITFIYIYLYIYIIVCSVHIGVRNMEMFLKFKC